jgi:hypothetical protein
MPLYNPRIIREGVFAVIVSTVFFLLVMFPNVPLGLEQVKRTYIGYDALAESPSQKLDSFVDLIEKSKDPAEWYIDEHISYASDFELWGNMDYWETPDEVISQGRTDCEGKAILTKAALALVNKRAILNKKETETVPLVIPEIKPQQQHVYVEVKKEENITGSLVNTTVSYYKIPEPSKESYLDKTIKGLQGFSREVPAERQILLGAGLCGIWSHYLLRIRRIYKEGKKRKKITEQKQ